MASRWYENSPGDSGGIFKWYLLSLHYGGMAEKIKHRTTGLLFDPMCNHALSNSFLFMAQHPDLLLDMKIGSKKHSLSYDSVLQSHLSLYAM